MNPHSRVRVGLVGLGSIARRIYLPVLASLPEVDLVAAVSRRQETLQEVGAYYKFRVLSTELNELIAAGCDAAFVLTPKNTHPQITMFLLEAGVNVYCEKPMAESIRQANEMAKKAEDTGKILMVGFNRRFAPCYAGLKDIFRTTAPDVCIAEKNRPGTEYRATLENAIHMVDLLRWYCGEAVGVRASAKFTDPYYETSVVAHLQFDSGATGVLVANRSAGQWVERVEAYGSGTTVVVEAPERISVVKRDHGEVVDQTPLDSGWAGVHNRLGFQQAVQHFLHCVATGARPISDASDAIKTHALMSWILREAGLPSLE